MRGMTMPLQDDHYRMSKSRYHRVLQPPIEAWQSSCTLQGVMAHSYNFTPRGRDRDDSRAEMFQSLEFKGSRKRSLSMSLAVHGALMSVLLIIPLLFHDAIK